MDQIDISYFARTKPEAIDFSERIGVISSKLYQAGFNLDKTLSEILGIQKKDKFISLLREQKVSTESIQDLKNFLTKIQETVQTLPVLSLSLAFEPNDQTLQLLSSWFMLNIKKQVLFDITVDPRMIAGVAISYNGRYLDFSIKDSFTKVVQEMLNPNPKTDVSEEQKKQIRHDPEHMHL